MTAVGPTRWALRRPVAPVSRFFPGEADRRLDTSMTRYLEVAHRRRSTADADTRSSPDPDRSRPLRESANSTPRPISIEGTDETRWAITAPSSPAMPADFVKPLRRPLCGPVNSGAADLPLSMNRANAEIGAAAAIPHEPPGHRRRPLNERAPTKFLLGKQLTCATCRSSRQTSGPLGGAAHRRQRCLGSWLLTESLTENVVRFALPGRLVEENACCLPRRAAAVVVYDACSTSLGECSTSRRATVTRAGGAEDLTNFNRWAGVMTRSRRLAPGH